MQSCDVGAVNSISHMITILFPKAKVYTVCSGVLALICHAVDASPL